jgi:hypothetical protein
MRCSYVRRKNWQFELGLLVFPKSIATIKRIMASLQEKQYIRRVNGKRYGKWEVLIKIE